MLSREEIAGVIAHELAHIRNRDTLTMTITATIAGAISMVAQFGMFFGGHRDNNQRSRHDRHHRDGDSCADRGHAGADGDQPHPRVLRRQARRADFRPPGCAGLGAGAEISNGAAQIENPSRRAQSPATAHLFIVNPLTHHGIDNLFATHPSTENRIAALEQLAREMGQGGFGGRAAAPAHPEQRASGPWGGGAGRGPWG